MLKVSGTPARQYRKPPHVEKFPKIAGPEKFQSAFPMTSDKSIGDVLKKSTIVTICWGTNSHKSHKPSVTFAA